MKYKLIITTIFISFFSIAKAQAIETAQCENGYYVYFLNGIRTEEANAYINANRVRLMFNNEYNGEPLSVWTSYNKMDGLKGLGDLVEVFAQKMAEDPTLKWQLFFRWVSGKFISSSLSIALQDYIDTNGTQKLSQAVASLSSPQAYSDEVVVKLSETYQQSLLAGKRVMVVSHSQGNLYANAIYGRLQSINSDAYNLNAFGIAGVASPANFVATGDDWVTSDTDHVIDLLRLFAPATLSSNDPTVPFYTSEDILGHGFSEIYTNPLFENLRNHTKNVMLSTLARLSTVTPSGSGGPITATLTWSSPGDIDLHTYDPASHVYYANSRSSIGYLDVDDTTGTGPEHYYASCDNFQTGNYSFGVNYYSGSGTKQATIKLSVLGVDYPARTVTVTSPRGSSGNNSPTILYRVLIENTVGGGWSATIQ